MDEIIKFFVGLDVHKESIAVAVAEAGRAPARLVGSIAHDVGKLIKLLARYGEPGAVQVVYEAGVWLAARVGAARLPLSSDCAVVDPEACR
jgi:transposase